MKKITLFAALVLVVATFAAAAVVDLQPANITLKSHDDANWLVNNGVNIEEMHGNIAEVRLTKAQVEMLTAAGYAVTPRVETVVTPKLLSGYHNYTQLTSFLDSIHTKYPAITKKVSFGTTVQGRSLWAFLVTSNPDSQMNKPEVRLAANIHGDEVVGKELLLDLIDSLTKSYGSNATITNYVNNREIWFVPSLNPDGNNLSQRYNANGEDLNRDYPVPNGSSNGGSVSGTETETQQTMSYWGTKHPVLSMTFHGGAIVANYPWDYTTTLCPDDALARAVALGYSQLNSTMYNSTEFTNGITNGGAWYIVRGSLQDWSYNTTGGLEITVECSNDKWPSASTLSSYWNDNKNSLLYYIRKAGEGIGGVVTDSTTGLPLNGVTVTVSGTGKAITTDVPGDYHRMLTTGTYSLTFAKTGYTAKTISSVSVTFDNLTTLNVALNPTGSSTPTLAIGTTSWAPVAAGATSSAVSVSNSGSSSVIAYTVSSNQTWLTVSSASGSTPGSFTMTAAANTTTSSRSATVTVTATTSGVSGSPKTISITQAAASSTPTLAISSTSWAPVAAGATSSAINVTNSGTSSVIAYTVSSNQTWLTVSSASGNTPGSFTMTASANTGAARTATVTVAATGLTSQTIAISQAAGTSGQNDAGTGADAGNDFASATLVSPGSWTGCYLDATDRNDYYKFNVTSGQVIKVKVTPPSSADYDLYLYNPSQTQVGTSTAGTGVADSVVYTATVSGTFYAKAYEYSGTGNYSLLISVSGGTTPTTILAISSTSWAPVAAGGTSSAINVTNSGTSGSVIAYTVSSDQTWLTVSSASGNTPGSFTMTAAANSGAARSATVTVAATGQTSKTIAVSQAAGGTSGTWTDVAATTQSAHPYVNSYNNTWTITGPAGATKMKVYFDSINVETRYDSVFVLNSAGTVVQSFTGAKSKTWSAEVTGNVVKIKLKSDASVTGYGFLSSKYSYYTASRQAELAMAFGGALSVTELLCQNVPNPATTRTRICFNLQQPANISLRIYNLNGQLIRTLVNGSQSAGFHDVEWDTRDERGCDVANGIYVYRLVSGNQTAVRKLSIVR